MKQKLLHKLNKRQGFSLTEMLATVLIMGFVGIIITTGAATVQRVYRKVVAHANAQTALTTTITLMKDQLAFADPESVGNGSETGTGFGNSQTIVFKNLNSGEQTITLNPGTASGTAATDPSAAAGGTNGTTEGAADVGTTGGGNGTNGTGTANRGFTLTYTAGDGTGTSSTSLPLLSDSAITSDLCVCFDTDADSGFSWDPATKVITVTKLVAKDTRTDTVQARASFKVLLVNDK
ncbi:PulJ/GspJ family protein [Oribacterium sp. HCP3S3_B9]|uniref:PulJ/GspJ family protein n=1 Tax=Oribacterium sp. HCP3S3_B9 TaxID=3438946 RepID=UPI003F88EC38